MLLLIFNFSFLLPLWETWKTLITPFYPSPSYSENKHKRTKWVSPKNTHTSVWTSNSPEGKCCTLWSCFKGSLGVLWLKEGVQRQATVHTGGVHSTAKRWEYQSQGTEGRRLCVCGFLRGVYWVKNGVRKSLLNVLDLKQLPFCGRGLNLPGWAGCCENWCPDYFDIVLLWAIHIICIRWKSFPNL